MKLLISIILVVGALSASSSEEMSFEEFDRKYPYIPYQRVEENARQQRDENGDFAYLLHLYSYRELGDARSSYEFYGAHPETGAPNQFRPEQKNRELAATRVFVSRNYLHFWAASLAVSDHEWIKSTAKLRRTMLTYFYHEDLALQQQVKELIAKYSNDETPLIAGVKASDVIRHMKEYIDASSPDDWDNLPLRQPENDPFSENYVPRQTSDSGAEANNPTEGAIDYLDGGDAPSSESKHTHGGPSPSGLINRK